MHPILISPSEAAMNQDTLDEHGAPLDGPTVAGWYCRDEGGWHGPFLEGYAEAVRFVEYCENQERVEARDNRTLYAGSEKF